MSTKVFSSNDQAPHDKAMNFSSQYQVLKAQQQTAIQKVIDNSKVAHIEVFARSKEEQEAEKKKRETKAKGSSVITNILEELTQKNQEVDPIEGEKLANGFFRSKRNLALRIKDEMNNQVSEVEQEKTELIQKLNHALVRLDKLNTKNRTMSNDLVDKIKFVRDLQKATSGGDDMEGIISNQMKEEFRREQQINHRLREEIKKCEMDRLRILERLKLLSGEKEITIQTGDGIQKTYKVTTINIQKLISDLNYMKSIATDKEEIYARARSVVNEEEVQIIELERQLFEQRRLRDEAGIATAEQQKKWDDTIGQIEQEIQRKKRLHKMHVKLCSTRHFEETMQKVLCRNKQIAFDWMKATIVGNFKKFGSIWQLRKMFLSNDRRRAKNALSRWFKIACDPVALIKMNKQIPELYAASISKNYFFNKWKIIKAKKQAFQLNRSLKLQSMWFKLNRYWVRRMKVNFLCWRDSLIHKNEAIKQIFAFANEQHYFRITHAFMKWRNFKDSQDFNVRMHSLSLSLAVTRFQSSILSAWRNLSLHKREKRKLILRQAYKCLSVHAYRTRQLKRLEIGAFSLQKAGQKNTAKQCFDAIRINAESSKLQLLSNKLQQDSRPAIQALNFKIANIQRKQKQDEKKRNTNVLMTLFGRLLSSYFHHWRKQSSHNSIILNTTFKNRLNKLHKDNMQKAFNMWRNGRSQKIIEIQMFEIQELQAGNFEIEQESKNVERAIQQKVESIKSSASKKMSKLVTQAFQNNIKHYFNKWRANINNRNQLKESASLILKKIYKRQIRMGWDKYKRGVDLCIQEEKCNKRVKEIHLRLGIRTKKRIFNAVCCFANNHFGAKNFLRNLLKRLDKHNKLTALKIWKKFNFDQNIEKLNDEQAAQVGNMQELINFSGQQSDQLTELREANKKLDKALRSQAEKTLQKWVLRSLITSLKYFFLNWKQVSEDQRRTQQRQISTFNHIHKIKLRFAFRQWSLTLVKQDQLFLQELIERESVENGCLQSALELQLKDGKVMKDKSSKVVEKLKTGQIIANEKTAQIIMKIIKLNDTNHFQSKRRACFLNWKEYIQRRKRCCKLLSRAVFMIQACRTFAEIRDFAREKKKNQDTLKSSSRIFNLWHKCLLKRAFNKWRVTQYHSIKDQIRIKTQKAFDSNQDHIKRMTKARGQFADVKSRRILKQSLQQLFNKWQQYSNNKKSLRQAAESLKQNIGTQAVKRALLKWKMRKEITLKMRSVCGKGKYIKTQLNKHSVFKAWKREFLIVKRMCSRVDQIMTTLVNLQKHRSYDIVKRYAVNRFETIKTRKNESQKRLIAILKSYNEGRMRRALVLFKENADVKSEALVRFKSILTLNSVRSLRRVFMKWKMKAHEQEVTMQNEMEDGPVNLQCFLLKQQNMNLEKLLLQDGSTPNQILSIQQDAENKFKSFVEQSLCRLLCRAEPDLQILPFFLDRWKKFTKTRKIWKRILQQCNHRQSRDTTMTSKLWAFQKWKYNQCDRENALIRIPFPQLQKICVQTVEKLELLADALEGTEEVKQSYLQQRNELLRNQIGGQKIAFALARNNQQKAKQQVMARWLQSGNVDLKNKIEDALMRNLNKIRELKDRIDSLENHNDMLAEQNDTYRQGALDGILMAKHCDELHMDRENLSVDLADKAITIRKLLEDNSYLHGKVQDLKSNNQGLMKDLASSLPNERPSRDY